MRMNTSNDGAGLAELVQSVVETLNQGETLLQAIASIISEACSMRRRVAI
jgi:hypothetical protein